MNNIEVFNKFESQLATLEQENEKMEFDVETLDGEAECKEWHRTLRKAWNAVEKVRKDTKADYLRLGREVDEEAKKIQGRLDQMANPHKVLLDAKAARIQAEIDAKIEAERLKAEIEEAEREAYVEYQERENARRLAEIEAKEKAIRDEEERIRREKELEEAKKIAAEEARKQAEIDKQEALERAEREKQEAIEEEKRKAKAEADRKAKEIADKYAAEQAEQDRLADIERKRIANEEHRESIENAIIDALVAHVDLDEIIAGEVMDAIRSGNIPHITINY